MSESQKRACAMQIYKESGYGLTQAILDASLYGVSQKRKRFVLIRHLGSSDGFMDVQLAEKRAGKSMTIAEYFGTELDIRYYYRHPRSYVRRGTFSVDEPGPTIRGVNRPMPNSYKLHPK